MPEFPAQNAKISFKIPNFHQKILHFFRFPGLREVRWMPNTKDFAFIEYESEDLSEPARQALDNFRITPTQQITVKFASK